MTAETMVVAQETQAWWLSRGWLVAWWVLAGIALGFALGAPPVQRTQEARVLETAREMLGNGAERYLVPELNGNLRVRKPPLTYWMAAGAYKIGGVSETVGRVPTVLVGWLTLGMTFWGARWLFGTRAGLFACGTLLTSYLFFRHTRLAETDAPAMLFVTIGVLALWRGAVEVENAGKWGFWWFHLGAVGTSLAIMSKGPPGFYPPLFLLAWCAVRWRWDVLRRFLLSGAPVTALVIAVPWFVYVLEKVGLEQWKKESDELIGGDGHGGIFLVYFPQLIQATAPWCLVVGAGIVAASQKVLTFYTQWPWVSWDRRSDWRLQGILLWIGSIFIPLCFLGNKQFHYLTSLMPPLMMLAGWWLDWVIGAAGDSSRRRVPLIDATMLLGVLGVPGILIAARLIKGKVGFYDIALVVLLTIALTVVWLIYYRRGMTAALVAYIVAAAVVFIPAVGVWVPLTEPGNSRAVARAIKSRFGDGPYCFYGPAFSLTLCFNLRSEIPLARGPGDLEKLASRTPGLIAIGQTKSKYAPPPPPPSFEPQPPDIEVPGQSFRVYKQR